MIHQLTEAMVEIKGENLRYRTCSRVTYGGEAR